MQVGERGADEDVHPPQKVVLRVPIFEPELAPATESPFGRPLKLFIDNIGHLLASSVGSRVQLSCMKLPGA